MNRRQFCLSASHALSLAVITGAAGACAGNPMGADFDRDDGVRMPAFAGEFVNGTLTAKPDVLAALANPGTSVLVSASPSWLVVSRITADQFAAVSALCPHEGCTVDRIADRTLICPCHGSAFTQEGTLVQGPASQPLQAKQTAFVNGVLTITA
jgi:Rieske Fe-S protein